MKVLIAGCGYLGMFLGARLVGKGDLVWGLRRNSEFSSHLKKEGIKPLHYDLLKRETLRDLPQADVVVFCQAPSNRQDTYRRTYYEATRNLLANVTRIQKIIMISSTSVYGTQDGSWVDESTQPHPEVYPTKELMDRATCLLETEDLVTKAGFPSVIFRLGGLYGPNRHRVNEIKSGQIKPVLSEQIVNRIHVEDAVEGLLLLIHKGEAGEIYLGVDDEPTSKRDFYTWLYKRLSMHLSSEEPSSKNPQIGSNKRCSNRKIKDLGLKLKYPNFRVGFETFVDP